MGGSLGRIAGVIRKIPDSQTPSSDKRFTVPNGHTWRLVGLSAKFTTSATAGNRSLVVRIKDEANHFLFRFESGITQAPSTVVTYTFGPGFPNDSSATSGTIRRQLGSETYLADGFSVYVTDVNEVQVEGGDDIEIFLMVVDYVE